MTLRHRSRWLPRLIASFLPLAAATGGCGGEPATTDSSSTQGTTTSNTGGTGGTAGSGGGTGGQQTGGGGSAGQGGTGGQEIQRGPVSFTTSPGLVAKVGEVYLYPSQAVQENAQAGDVLVYSLVKAPAGMVIDAKTGEVMWTPEPGQIGMSDVSLAAQGPDGQSAQQDYAINVEPAVTIASLSPAAGTSAGNELVTILGSGFKGNVGVMFGSLPAAAVMIVDENTLSVTTPAAVASTRSVTVSVGGVTQATFNPGFTHLPSISSTDVSAASLSSNLKVQGIGFDPGGLEPNALSIAARGGTQRKIVTNSSVGGELVFTLGVGSSESTLATGAIAVEINGLRSNWVPLGINNALLPAELAVTSTDGAHAPGTNVTLIGAGFAGLLPADLTVTFAGAAAAATVVSVNAAGTQVVVALPVDAVTGPVKIAAPGRLPATSHVVVAVTGTTAALAVLDTTPAGGLPGSALVLRGSGFVPDPMMNKVTFDGVTATVLSAEADRLVVEVPPQGLGFGPAEVLLDSGGKSAKAGIFSVLGPYKIIAGSALDDSVTGDDGPPAQAPMDPAYLATDLANNYYIADRKWIRVINNGASPLSAFGVVVAAGTIKTVVPAAETVSAIVVHPVTEDLYFAAGARIYQAKRSDGTIQPYAGTAAPGNGGNGGFRLSASFNGISGLEFTLDGLLVIADNNNGTIRAINTTGTAINRYGQAFAADLVEQIAAPGTANPTGLALDVENSIYTTTFTQLRKVPFDRLAVGQPGYAESIQIAGNGLASALPEEGCPALQKSLGTNDGIAIDGLSGNAFLGSRHGLVRRIKAAGGTAATLLDTDDCIDYYAGSWPAGQAIPSAGYAGDGGAAKSAVLSLFARPFVDRKGKLLLPAEGRVRSVDFDMNGNPGAITTLAGVGPAPLENALGSNIRGINTLGDIVVDKAKDRYLYTTASRVLGQDRATGVITVLAGTGNLGNTLGAGSMAPQSDLGVLRGIDLTGTQLYLLEATIPRVSTVDLAAGKLAIVAGDGRTATLAQQQAPGVAATSRVAINTGAPKAVVGPDGALYFADKDLLRVINPTAMPITTFGVTIPAGGIDDLPIAFGANLSGIAFDVKGALHVASYDSGAVWRVANAAPFTPEAVVIGDGQRYGVSVAGAVADLHLNRPSDLEFLADGSLLIANDFGNTMVMIEADAMGQIGQSSHFSHVFGSGAPGKMTPAVSSLAVTPSGVRAAEVDGSDLLILGGDRVVKVTMP
jgi:hypothetical protein